MITRQKEKASTVMNTSSKSLISVIVPVYNAGPYIEQCIQSILNQTYTNIEIIIVNDGSTDESDEICLRFKDNKKIQYYTQENAGAAAARNKGLSVASGEYLMFVDGDDYLSPDIIQTLMSASDASHDIVCCCCMAVRDDGRMFPDHFFSSDRVFDSDNEKAELYCQLIDPYYGQKASECVTAIGVPWGKIYRKAFIDENHLSFDTGLKRDEDNVFNMFAFESAHSISYINNPLYYYRLQHISITSGKQALKKIDFWANNSETILRLRREFFMDHPEYLTESVNILLRKSTIKALSNRLTAIVFSHKIYDEEAKIEYTNIMKTDLYLKLPDLVNSLMPDGLSRRDRIKTSLLLHRHYHVLFSLMKLWFTLKGV